MRIGTGYDVHRLVAGRKLILGGVEIPYEKGLLGHSDADVLVHAVMDALLGAELGRRGVCVRAGLHCAPLAHESAGTIENGTVRLSFSPFNSSADADRAAAQLRASVKSLLDD